MTPLRPGTDADLDAVAAIQADGFPDAWDRDVLDRLRRLPGAIWLVAPTDDPPAPAGYVLGQLIVDEAEVHSLAVGRTLRRAGLGRRLLAGFEALAAGLGGRRAVLEVAADNPAALALYREAGYREVGRRPAYYRMSRVAPVDALVLAKHLTGQGKPG